MHVLCITPSLTHCLQSGAQVACQCMAHSWCVYVHALRVTSLQYMMPAVSCIFLRGGFMHIVTAALGSTSLFHFSTFQICLSSSTATVAALLALFTCSSVAVAPHTGTDVLTLLHALRERRCLRMLLRLADKSSRVQQHVSCGGFAGLHESPGLLWCVRHHLQGDWRKLQVGIVSL